MASSAGPGAAVVLVVILGGLAGCLSGSDEGPPAPPPPPPPEPEPAPGAVLAIGGCGSCYEPTATWVNGTLLVSVGSGRNVTASRDGGRTFQPVAPPPLPEGYGGDVLGDVTLQTDPEGSLWWSDLLQGTGLASGGGMRIARSDDGGLTWALVRRLSPAGDADANALVDRNWLAFGPAGQVLAACTCPAVASPMVALSTDRGATFGPFLPVPAQGRPGPIGPPAWSASGVAIPHLLAAGAGARGPRLESQGVGVVHGSGEPAAWMPMPVVAQATVAAGFPGAAADGAAVHVSWSSPEGGPRVASSGDGGMAWSEPVAVADGPALYPNAWVAAHAGRLAVAWFADNGTGVDYRVAVGPPQGPFATVLSAPLPPATGLLSSGANTDFPFVAWSPDGRLAAVWSAEGVRVQVLTP